MSIEPKNKAKPVEDVRWLGLYAKKLEFETVECFKYFRAEGFEPILFKGWAAARNYPPDVQRAYTDIDLSFAAKDFEKATARRRADASFKYTVDLHREFRNLETRPWDEVFANSTLVELNGYPVRVPSDEDHLRMMAVHWLGDGGERRHRLWDIFHAVGRRKADFRWEECLETVTATRRQWVVTAIGLTHRYLGLDIDDLPFRDEANKLPEWLTSTIEREWRSDVRIRPLATSLSEPRELFRQIRKRIPPNPLQATIEMEGDILRGPRIVYQIGSIRRRLVPSLRDLAHRILGPKT